MLLGEVAKIKHGWAFKSKYFSEDSNYPILLTPGNFTLDGELYFTAKNTKRYCGEIPEDYVLYDNEIVVVMTDLTPAARLLGMPAFVRLEETILHNQRIGKLIFDEEKILPEFLYFNLLNDGYRRQVRQTASGSTVKHTSPDRLLSAKIFLPPINVQCELVGEFETLAKGVALSRSHLSELSTMASIFRNDLVGAGHV